MIRQNTLTDNKGKPRFRHNIAALLGLESNDKDTRATVPLSDIPFIDGTEGWEDNLEQKPEPKKKRKTPAGTPTISRGRYADPMKLVTDYQQRGRGEGQVIKTKGNLLSPIQGGYQQVKPEILEEDENTEPEVKKSFSFEG